MSKTNVADCAKNARGRGKKHNYSSDPVAQAKACRESAEVVKRLKGR